MPAKEFYNNKAEAVLKKMGTSPQGLSKSEAQKRLSKHGRNELILDVRQSKWLMLLSQFKEVLVVLLIIAGIISFFIGSYRDGVVMFAIVIINAVIGFVQQYKAERIIDQLKNLIQSPAKVIRDGEIMELSQGDLVPGDIVHIEEGDMVPADLRVLESFNLRTDDFSLTGESMPQGKHSNAIEGELVLGDIDNMAFVGTTVATGDAKGVVTATGMDTELGKIADLTQSSESTLSPLQKELGNLGNRLTVVVVITSIALFFVAQMQDFSLYLSLIYALGIAVACVPQALPAQVTVALSTASKRLAESRAVVKNLSSVETLGSTTVICTDKTGTLTKNEMTVQKVWFNGKEHSMTGTGYEPEGNILGPDGKALDQAGIDDIEIMMDAATMASNAEIHAPDENHTGWYPIGDPTEAALITMSMKLGTRSPKEDEENPELHEFPFDSERKRMSSVRQFGDKQVLTMKGAMNSVLGITKHIYRNGRSEPFTDNDRKELEAVSEAWSKEAMRVLCIAYRPLEPGNKDYVIEEVEKDVIFLGMVAMTDPPKEGVKEAMASAHTAHIKTFIMTGDHALTAQAVGLKVGLSMDGKPSPVVTGVEMHKMKDQTLVDLMEKSDSLIFSRVDPEDKLRIVTLLEDNGEIVAVTGDGVNDAPALKKAHIGVAMGQTGTDVAKEAAELVLLDDSFSTLVQAVQEGRTIYENLKKTVLASMTTNGAELAVILLGLAAVGLWDWPIPILAIQVLAIDLLAEVMPLTFLTFDPPPADVMEKMPRSQKDHIINKFTSVEVIFLGALMGFLAFANFGLYMDRSGIALTMDDIDTLHYARAATVTYLTIAFCQYANIMARRYSATSTFNRNIVSNRILLASIAVSCGLMMVAIYGPMIPEYLSFAALRYEDWLSVLVAACGYLLVFELIKGVKILRKKRSGT